MLIITDKQKQILEKFLPGTAEALLATDDINPIIDQLDDLAMSLFDVNDNPTEQSRSVERFMDELTNQNI